jgi:hypothetical protein
VDWQAWLFSPVVMEKTRLRADNKILWQEISCVGFRILPDCFWMFLLTEFEFSKARFGGFSFCAVTSSVLVSLKLLRGRVGGLPESGVRFESLPE